MTLWIILSNLNEINFHKMDVGEGGVKRSLPRNCRLTITLIQQTLACKKKKKKNGTAGTSQTLFKKGQSDQA